MVAQMTANVICPLQQIPPIALLLCLLISTVGYVPCFPTMPKMRREPLCPINSFATDRASPITPAAVADESCHIHLCYLIGLQQNRRFTSGTHDRDILIFPTVCHLQTGFGGGLCLQLSTSFRKSVVPKLGFPNPSKGVWAHPYPAGHGFERFLSKENRPKFFCCNLGPWPPHIGTP